LLEIIDPAGDASDHANWRASRVLGGSPPRWDGGSVDAGDYNRDSQVDDNDFLAWRRPACATERIPRVQSPFFAAAEAGC
jgi:hypothetical protein